VACCCTISSLLLLVVNKLKKFILFQQRRHRKIWNQLPSASFGLIYMAEGQNGTHLQYGDTVPLTDNSEQIN
jgi:hypothetical protein